MRTTVDLPDDLFRRAKAHAALNGMSLKELIAGSLAKGLRGDGARRETSSRRKRSKLPIARRATGRRIPALSNARLFRLLDEEDVKRAGRG
jgi:hypothetical protein